MAGHTPGPWVVKAQRYSHPGSGRKGAHHWITTEDGQSLPMDSGLDPSAEANARLIAVAPNLFEACKVILEEYDDHPDEFPRYSGLVKAIEQARTAIAEAEGGREEGR
jgi:hypothetical protein